MSRRGAALAVAVLAPTLGIGLGITGAAYSALGGDTAFLREQVNARPARAVDLERVMRTTPEPYGDHTRNVRAVQCRSRGAGELQNPWTCRASYYSGRRATFRVLLRADGSFVAAHREGSGSITGCCVEL